MNSINSVGRIPFALEVFVATLLRINVRARIVVVIVFIIVIIVGINFIEFVNDISEVSRSWEDANATGWIYGLE